MESKIEKLFVALKAFIVIDSKVLLLQESAKYKDGTNLGKWDVVGGRVTPGEYFEDALKREVKEETGLEIELGRPFMLGEWRPEVRGEHWQVIATFVICKALNDKVRLSEDHQAFKWINPKEYQNEGPFTNFTEKAFESYINLENK